MDTVRVVDLAGDCGLGDGGGGEQGRVVDVPRGARDAGARVDPRRGAVRVVRSVVPVTSVNKNS